MSDDEKPPEHELSLEQDAELKSCANHALAWGIVCIVAGVVCLGLAGLAATGRSPGTGLRLYLPAGVLNLAVGINFCRAGVDFRGAVSTRGRDISYVMQGLGHLSSALLVQIVLAVATVLLATASAVFLGASR
jgi:hypothetical protein